MSVGPTTPVAGTAGGKVAMCVRRLRQVVATLGVGSRIPGERDLAADWGVARMTARAAIDVLIAEGQLERRPGAGTYIVVPPYAKTLGLSSFTSDMRSRGRVPSSRLLGFATESAGVDNALRLGIDEDEPVVHFSRLRLADGEPIAVELNWIPVDVVPGLEASDLDGSLFALLADRYDITPGEATSTIDAVIPDAATARALELAEHVPCLRIRMDYLDQGRRSLMVADGYYVGSRYQLQITLGAGAFAPSRLGGS